MAPYRRLFQIKAFHPYFADTVCRSIEWLPSPASHHTMNNLGLLYRPEPAALSVYYSPDQCQVLALIGAGRETEPADLCFKAYVRDPNFHNYTLLPAIRKEHMLWLDSARSVAEASGEFRLHPKATVSAKECASLAHLRGQRILTREDQGIAPVCGVQIHLFGKNGPLSPRGDPRPKTYRLCFNPRQTYWKYYVLGPLATKKISIQDKDGKCLFKTAAIHDMFAARPAAAFISTTRLPLQQLPSNNFQLMLRLADMDKVLIKKLPGAPVHVLHREKQGTKDIFVSEIFINA